MLWATDDWWAVGLIDGAPNAGRSPRSLTAPPGVRGLRVPVDGATLDVWIVDPEHPTTATVLVLHGIRGTKVPMLPLGRKLASEGWRAVLVDHRGHGGSTGAHLTYGVHESADLIALVDQLEARGELVGPLAVHGTSYGAATALLYAAGDPRVEAVVAIAPFASLREVVPSYIERVIGPLAALVPGAWVNDVIDRAGERGAYDPDAACPACAAPHVRGAVFLAHGDADRRIPPWNGARIAEGHDRVTDRRVYPGALHDTVAAAAADDAEAFLRARLP